MRKVLSLKFLFITILLSAYSNWSLAATYQLSDVNSRLNVRSCGELTCSKLCDISNDTPLEIVSGEETEAYQKVNLPESLSRCPSTGWVSKDFLKEASNGETLFANFGRSEQEISLDGENFIQVDGINSTLNVRQCGRLTCANLCQIENETPLVDLGEETDAYVKVQIPTTYRNCPASGWVAKEFVKESTLTSKDFADFTITTPPEENSTQLTATISTRNYRPNFFSYVYGIAGVMFSANRNYNGSCSHNGSKAASSSLGYCYRWVKCQLKNTGITSRYLSGGSAKNAGGELRSIGLRNIINNVPGRCANNAPNGAVLVYSGGSYGHIETKSRDKYISDYRSNRARTGSTCRRSGRGRTLTGVYVR